MHSITGLYHREMKKNIIIVLAVLVFMFGLYAFTQKGIADGQRFKGEQQRQRADSLQQQLDKCK